MRGAADLREQTVPAQRPGHRLGSVDGADAPDRHARLLHDVADGGKVGGLDGVVLAGVRERLALPQPGDDVEALVHQLGADTAVALLAELVESGVDGAEADRQRHPAVRQSVDGGDLAGQLPRPPARWWGQQRAEADARRADGGDRQADPCVDAPHGLPHEQPVPSGVFSGGGEIADRVGVGPWHHEPVAHAVDSSTPLSADHRLDQPPWPPPSSPLPLPLPLPLRRCRSAHSRSGCR